jgi:hypothetical protein
MTQKTIASYLDIKAGTSFVKIDAETAHRYVKGEISWQEVMATEVWLNPDSKNRYLADAFGPFTDETASAISKVTVDSLGLSDEQSVELQKAVTDAFSVSDEVTLAVGFVREPVDPIAFSDSDDFELIKVLTDSFGMDSSTEAHFAKSLSSTFDLLETDGFSLNKPVTDDFDVSDVDTFVFTKTSTDSFDLGDAYGSSFTKALFDGFTMDDAATVDAITKDTGSEKANIFGLNDDADFGLTKNPSDSFSVGDDFSFVMISNNSAVLNAVALNTFTLNS